MFLSSRMYRPAMKSNQPPTKRLLVVLPPVKGPEQEVDHLPPPSVDVKNVCEAIPLHLLHVIMACTGQTSHLLMLSTGACCPRMCDISKSNSCKFHGRIYLILLKRTF